MSLINWTIAKHPVNYLIVASMAMIGFLVASIITAPLRRVSAQ